MLNKLPIGQAAAHGDVGGGGTGNDQKNKDALMAATSGITRERKRARYSMCCFALNGPNLLANPGVWDWINGSDDELKAPDRTGPITLSQDVTGAGKLLYWEYGIREPFIFMGGQVAIGYIKGAGGDGSAGTTTVHIDKVEDASDSSSTVSVGQYKFDHGADGKLGPNSDNRDVLIELPGKGAFFDNGERFRIRIEPDTDTAANWYEGLQGVSVILWFKALHM